MTFLEQNEPIIRLTAFFSIFAGMALWEAFVPRRVRLTENGKPVKWRRWLAHGGLVLVDSAMLRLVFPAAAVGTAAYASSQGWGLFNNFDISPLLAGLIAFVVLDFAVWLEHLASHKIPILWRIHKMHHADPEFDVTTALRFHPLEIVLSMVWKAGFVIALGAPVAAVLLFEIVLNGMAMFNHSNVKLPKWLDGTLRSIFVTPDMHRVHHSVDHWETDSNYGFNFSFWDRLFATYTAQPAAGHEGMKIGLNEYSPNQAIGLLQMLLIPFRRPKKASQSELTQKKFTGK